MTDEEWDSLHTKLQAHTNPPKRVAPEQGGYMFSKPLEYPAAFARGALKQSFEAPGLRAIEPQGLLDWAKSVDPKHPTVEGYGRYVTPTNVALAGLPELSALKGIGPAISNSPRLQELANLLAQNTWKSALGGATQAKTDTKTGKEATTNIGRGAVEGAETGIAGTLGQAALRALPRWAIAGGVGAAELAHYLSGGRRMPSGWTLAHYMADPLLAMAARAFKVPGGLMGAAGEGAAQYGGWEDSGRPPPPPQKPVFTLGPDNGSSEGQ